MLGPGIPNPMLFAGGDPLDEYGKIGRALRLRASVSPYLSRVFGAPTNQNKWTIAFSAKRGIFGTAQSNFTVFSLAGAETCVRYTGAGDSANADKLHFYNSASPVMFTSARLRDPAAHDAIVVSYDSSLGSANMKIEKNGVVIAQTNYTASTGINTAALHYIGALAGLAASNFFDGLLSNFAFVDGQALSSAAFGVLHPRTGQWRPKNKAAIRASVAAGGGARNGWGNNGFFLPFDDVTSLTTLGYDRSQSDTDTTGNNWTTTNISLTAGTTYDSVLDTPTNNFCTLNPLAWRNGAVQPTYSNGNLEVLNTSGVAEAYSLGTMPLPAGETYFEVTVLAVSAATPIIGVADTKTLTSVFTNTFGYMVTGQKQINGVNTAYGAAFTTGDVIGVRVNTTVPEIEFYKQTGGAGAFVSQGVIALNAGVEYFPYVNTVLNSKAAFNFGQRAFNNASPPTNAKMLCTKLLPVKPAGPMKSSSAFVAVTDTGANIAATLAAARAGFGSYIDIIKRREASEGWRWIFSDDPANYLDTSTTAAKAAVPAFSGTSYVGYSLKVSAANGVATGTFVHTNGANSVVSDGLSNARKMVILHRESAGGGDFFAYHPDLTAGKLLYLNNTTAETTDASINTVTASGFTAASTLPSGTYRWISIAELSGFISLNSYIANSSADGPFVNAGLSPAFSLQKSTSGSATRIKDIARTPNNLAQIAFDLNLPAAEDPNANSIDNVSNGIKEKANDAMNVSAQKYITLLIAAFPFRYANAR